jgi:hypothetical protein
MWRAGDQPPEINASGQFFAQKMGDCPFELTQCLRCALHE